jgi:hypothetical protein
MRSMVERGAPCADPRIVHLKRLPPFPRVKPEDRLTGDTFPRKRVKDACCEFREHPADRRLAGSAKLKRLSGFALCPSLDWRTAPGA